MTFRLILEMFCVGLALVAVSLGIALLEGQSLSDRFIWPMVSGVFLTGAATHLLFEVSGINEMYARYYTPIFWKR